MSKTGWGLLNYTRSRDVERRQERNLNECLRAGKAAEKLVRATARYGDMVATYGPTSKAAQKADARERAAYDRFNALHDSITDRDSAMK